MFVRDGCVALCDIHSRYILGYYKKNYHFIEFNKRGKCLGMH